MTQLSLQSIWRVFIKQFNLTPVQHEQFVRYIQELLQWNETINLTAAHNERELIQLHCADSLMVTKCLPMDTMHALADIGSGGGFPGIPLSIKYPEKTIYLLEVRHKKTLFLKHIIETVSLPNVHLITLDWRTFLRKTHEPIDMFCARASLDPDELIRLFKPSCLYRQAQLVYWASEIWQPSKKTAPYINNECAYNLGNRKRRLVVMRAKQTAGGSL